MHIVDLDALTLQQKSIYSQMSLRQKNYIVCWVICIIGFDTKPAESKVNKIVASKKVMPFVKPLSCFKVEGLEFLYCVFILLFFPGLSQLIDAWCYVCPSIYARYCFLNILI